MPATIRRLARFIDAPPRLPRKARAFGSDQRGAAAIEFGVVGLALVVMILLVLQFALLFLSQLSLHSALADAASGTQTSTQSSRTNMAKAVCERVILADSCATKMKLETAPLANYSSGQQAISGAGFLSGSTGDAMLVRAEVPLVVFVPGMPSLVIRGSALYVRS